tara:strand:+ start:35483 stop:38185 length:2703 start_codon:yes stop_codon:yes gene_type:complete
MKKITLLWVLSLAMTFAFGQNPYTITFQGETIEMPENIETFTWSDMPQDAKVDGGYVGWVQFYQTPTQSVQNDFKALNLKLIEYIPHYTYLFYFPANTSIDYLKDRGVRSIVPVEARFKIAAPLRTGAIQDHAWENGNVVVTLQHYEFVSKQAVLNDLAALQVNVRAQYNDSNIIDASLPVEKVTELAQQPYIKWVETIVGPDIKEDTRGKSLHRSSGLDTQTTTGRNYTGVGVGVLVRDDGIVGPHIDFEGRITNMTTDATGTHGDGVAGILAGAGNLDPNNRGMAAGSDVFVINYVSNFLDGNTTSLINNGDVQITNSSYGNGCNDGYTSIARTVDTQIHDNTSVMHVFSCGNSNGSNCGYGAGGQWGNITGGHKQGKNCIATANVFFDGSLVSSSSRGPATDGRIKPDIAANGQNQISTAPNNGYLSFGGTSGASPGIAGVSAQLYQMYEEINGSLPPSGLIKASLLNTANDYGNAGPDFKFGWGIVNGLRAGKLIEDDRFLSDDITQGASNTHTITIPSGTVQMRVMVYWTDEPGSPGANPALVNDLDMVVTDPSSNDYLPWILDSTPDPTALDLPATNGIDRLNNMEQVLINNPEAGAYDIEITGFNVPVGPQEYFVVYEVIGENLTLTYPNGGEHIIKSQSVTVHWDAINTTDPFTVEYSVDNGTSWSAIGTAPSDATNIDWNLPISLSNTTALVRVTSGSFEDVSDASFSVAPLTSDLTVYARCPEAVGFEWTPLGGAESYDIYILGDNYMELVGNSSSNRLTVSLGDVSEPFWYAIAARNDTEGWVGQRSNAIRYPGGEFECGSLSTEEFSDSQIAVYPNPASQEVFVQLRNGLSGDVQITLRNSLGQQLQTFQGNTNGNATVIPVAKYTTGLYFLTVTSGDRTITKKLLVQ